MIEVDVLFLWHGGLAVCLAFLVGLEFHKYQRTEGQGLGFGTARTLTLIGLLGFLLHALDPSGLLYALGFTVLSLWLALFYRQRLDSDYASLMAPIVGVSVYVLGLLAANSPPWFVAGYAVFLVFMLGAKPRIRSIADTLPGDEIATVVKFVIMTGIILPLLPDRQVAAFVPVTFRQTWVAVVAVSGISYLSYVLQTYVLKSSGVLAAGLLGGLYSSTATTFVLSNEARGAPDSRSVSPALMLATAMMYVRLLVLAALLAPISIARLAPPFTVAALSTIAAALVLARIRPQTEGNSRPAPDNHPLEFQVALLFAVLFVVFATATQYVVGRFQETGLQLMSFAIGFTEIDPFVLSVLSGHLGVSMHAAVDAVVIATGSNNILKALFALGIARNRSVLPACTWLIALTLVSLVYVWL